MIVLQPSSSPSTASDPSTSQPLPDEPSSSLSPPPPLHPSCAFRVWHNASIRNYILQALYKALPLKATRTCLARLLVLNKESFEAALKYLYWSFSPDEKFMLMGLRGYMEAAGASESRIRLYASRIKYFHDPRKFKSIRAALDTGPLRLYPTLKALYCRLGYDAEEDDDDDDDDEEPDHGDPLNANIRISRDGALELQSANRRKQPIPMRWFDDALIDPGTHLENSALPLRLTSFKMRTNMAASESLVTLLDPMTSWMSRTSFETLRHLDLSITNLSVAQISRLSLLFPGLEVLRFEAEEDLSEEVLALMAKRCKHIKELKIGGEGWKHEPQAILDLLTAALPGLSIVSIPLHLDVPLESPTPCPFTVPDSRPRYPSLRKLELQLIPKSVEEDEESIGTYDLACFILAWVDPERCEASVSVLEIDTDIEESRAQVIRLETMKTMARLLDHGRECHKVLVKPGWYMM